MAQQTAVSWLQDMLKETYDKEGKLPLAYTLHLVKQAKELEKKQIVKAHLDCWGTNKMSAEQYYNETYNK